MLIKLAVKRESKFFTESLLEMLRKLWRYKPEREDEKNVLDKSVLKISVRIEIEFCLNT